MASIELLSELFGDFGFDLNTDIVEKCNFPILHCLLYWTDARVHRVFRLLVFALQLIFSFFISFECIA